MSNRHILLIKIQIRCNQVEINGSKNNQKHVIIQGMHNKLLVAEYNIKF